MAISMSAITANVKCLKSSLSSVEIKWGPSPEKSKNYLPNFFVVFDSDFITKGMEMT